MSLFPEPNCIERTLVYRAIAYLQAQELIPDEAVRVSAENPTERTPEHTESGQS